MPRNIQYITVELEDKQYNICNFHGIWYPINKEDTKERIEQSNKIIEVLNTLQDETILCGDFNLRPDTKSIDIIEHKLKNLIKTYNIVSTRSSFYLHEIKTADYMFISPGIKLQNFEVLNNEVSDHLPLYLEFS